MKERSWEILRIERKKGSVMSLVAESENESRGWRGILKIEQRGSREWSFVIRNRGIGKGGEG